MEVLVSSQGVEVEVQTLALIGLRLSWVQDQRTKAGQQGLVLLVLGLLALSHHLWAARPAPALEDLARP